MGDRKRALLYLQGGQRIRIQTGLAIKYFSPGGSIIFQIPRQPTWQRSLAVEEPTRFAFRDGWLAAVQLIPTCKNIIEDRALTQGLSC